MSGNEDEFMGDNADDSYDSASDVENQLARGMKKLMRAHNRLEETGGLQLKNTKRMLFGYPVNSPKEYLKIDDYEAKTGRKVQYSELDIHAIRCKVDDRPGGPYVSGFETQKHQVVRDRAGNIMEPPSRFAKKAEIARYEKAQFAADTKFRRSVGLPPQKDMRLERKINPKDPGFEKNGTHYPKYQLSGKDMYYKNADGRELRREFSYSNKHKAASGEWAAEVWVMRKDGSTAARNFTKDDPIDSHKKVLKEFAKPGTDIEEVYYKSFKDNKQISKTDMDREGISAQAFINEFTNKHPGPDVALRIENEMYPADIINKDPTEAGPMHDILHGKAQLEGIDVMVKGRDGVLAHAQFVEADDPKHFKKVMEKHGIDPDEFSKMNGRPIVDKRTEIVNGKEKPIGKSAAAIRAEKTNYTGDAKEALWYHDKQTGTWRGASNKMTELKSLIKNGDVTKADMLVGRQQQEKDNYSENRENGPLNGHLKALNATHESRLPTQAKEILDTLQGRQAQREQTRTRAEKAYATPEPSPDRETFEHTYDERPRGVVHSA